jgi:hypothetical protein
MKKFFLFMIFAGLGLITIAQSTRIYDSNITIRKTTPTFSFLPSGGIINFNAGDVTLTHSANTLSLAGGILALPTSGLSLNGTTITTVGGNLVTLTDPSAITFIRINANNTISALSAANFKTALSFTSTDLDDIFLFNSTTDTLATRSYSRSFGGGGGGGSMVYPGAGIALSTGAAWGSSITNNSTNWNTAYTDRLKWDGGATDLVAGTGRTSLGGTTVGQAFFTLSNPGAITFARIDAANTVTARSAANFKADLSLENVTNESKATMFTNGIMTGSFTFPSPFTLGATSVTTTGTELNVLAGIPGTLTATELGCVDGATSNIQGQLSVKLNIANPTATGILTTPALRVGSGGNTVSLDSMTSVSSDIKFYDDADTLNPYIPVADRTELSTLVPMLADSNTVINHGYITPTYLASELAGYTPGGGSGNSVFVQLSDTVPLFEFSGGGGNAGDTVYITTSTLYGEFYNKGSDTLKITELRANMVAGGTPLGTDTLAIQVYWNDTLNKKLGNSYKKLNTANLGINSITTGTVDASFANDEIPPGVWVWCETPGVVLGRKPAMLTVTLSGYKIPKYIDRFSNIRMLSDTLMLATFPGGGGNANDTATFTTSTIYGAFFNKGSDTLNVTELRAVMGHGIGVDTLDIQVQWHTTLKSGSAVKLNTNALPINSITVGTTDTSFANAKIPPNVWVWATTPAVITGRKPTLLLIQLSGYKTPNY